LLHGTKDYLHLAQVAAAFPKLHQTFNLVPCLFEQIDDYARGQATGRFTRVCATPVRRLTDDHKDYILRFFFSINADKVIACYPPYLRLLHIRDEHLAQGGELPEWFWRDTIGWFNLAWIDQTILRNDRTLCNLTRK